MTFSHSVLCMTMTVTSDPFIFNGTKSLFLQWKGLMKEKLDVNRWRYLKEKEKITYTNSCLGPEPAGHVKPWKE